MGSKIRQNQISIDAQLLIQYDFTLLYRTCGIAQTRHPGEPALSGTEVFSFLHLAIDCHRKSPDQPLCTANRLRLIQLKFGCCLSCGNPDISGRYISCQAIDHHCSGCIWAISFNRPRTPVQVDLWEVSRSNKPHKFFDIVFMNGQEFRISSLQCLKTMT